MVVIDAEITPDTDVSHGNRLKIKAEYLLQPPDDCSRDSTTISNTAASASNRKRRVKPVLPAKSDQLCPSVCDVDIDRCPTDDDVPACARRPLCAYSHDINAYVDSRLSDVAEHGEDSDDQPAEAECPMFALYGRCRHGLRCVFFRSHVRRYSVDSSGGSYVWRNTYDSSKWKPAYADADCGHHPLYSVQDAGERNQLTSDLMIQLRKRTYNFEPAEIAVQAADSSSVVDSSDVERCQIDASSRIEWRDKLYLAPLTTLGNLPFRRLCKKLGADITCGEMALSQPLLQGSKSEWALMKRHASEDIFGVQIGGSNAAQMARAAQLVAENVDCDFIDINCGCPTDLLYKRGGGAALMNRPRCLELMTRSMASVTAAVAPQNSDAVRRIALTAKVRTGVYANAPGTAHHLLPSLAAWGVQMATVHGRSREQRYTRSADWAYIATCHASVAGAIPVFGNGDIFNFEDYYAQKESASVDGIMIGRGALIKPWLFTEIKERRHWDITASQRMELIRDYVSFGLDHWGSDRKGVDTTRRFLLEWLSFLHRYTPYGVIADPPQRLNQWVPRFRGRCEVETLLSSPSVNDWIAITEMHLGRVAADFHFEPKHKSNAY